MKKCMNVISNNEVPQNDKCKPFEINITKCENECDTKQSKKSLTKIKSLLKSELTSAIFDTQIEMGERVIN